MDLLKILALHTYVTGSERSIKELESIDTILGAVLNGKATDIITAAGLARFSKLNAVKKYFTENPGKYIFILGGHSITKNVIYKKASSFGIEKKHIKFFDEYEQLKNHNAMADVMKKDVCAVILGPVPHSAKGIEGHQSLKQAIAASISQEKIYTEERLKLSKKSFHNFFGQITTQLVA